MSWPAGTTWPIAVSPVGPVEAGTLLWRRNGSVRLTAVVKATFAMIHGGFCLPVDPKPLCTVERPWLGVAGSTPEAIIETWPELARPEVVLWGDALAPNREPVRALAVRLCVWKNGPRIDKTVHVLGARTDDKHLPSPFSTLPLLWERTTQGSRGTNPVGVREGRSPNLVHPTNPSEPACFAPRALGWPGSDMPTERGTATMPWSSGDAFPPRGVWDWPSGLDVEAFGSAPSDQRLDALEGDEWIILEGMNVDIPRFATRLPMPIATATLRQDFGGSHAIPLVMDTFLIDASTLQLSVLWRGSVPVRVEQIHSLMVEVDLDLHDAPRTSPPMVHDVVAPTSLGRGLRLNETSPFVGGQAPSAATMSADGASHPVFAPRRDTAPPMMSPAATMNVPAMPAFVKPPIVAPERISAAPIAPPRLTPAAVSPVVGPPVVGPPVVGPPVVGPPVVGPPVVGPPVVGPPVAGPPVVAPSVVGPAAETGVRAVVLARIASKQPLTDLSLAGADLSGLDLTEATLSGLNLMGARLSDAVLKNARLSNAKLVGADLSRADFSGADLTQADLSRAIVAEASFEDAQLLDANLGAAEGASARFDRARAKRAVFAQGKWHKSSFVDADLTGADLSGTDLSDVILRGATLANARFVDARGVGLDASSVKLADANLAGASFVDCDFTGIDAPRTLWDRAILDGSNFTEAKLDSAGFARAHLDRANFTRATLTKASFMGVTGEGASFSEANLEAVDLRQGKLVDATFEGARLCKVNALKASFSGAVLSNADLSGASLRSAKLRGAKLAFAILRDADLRDADLEQADLRNADRQGAKLAGASLKGAVEND